MVDRNTHTNKPLVVITGSSGLIGDALIASLVDYRIVGLDVVAPDNCPPHCDWIQCDMTENDSVEAALAQVRSEHGAEIASVVHLAAYYDFSGEPSPLYEELTVNGTRRLLRGLQSFRVEQFVFSSTLLVMAPSDDDQPLTVFSPTDAEWDYPQSKLAAERVIHDERNEIPSVVLRIAGVYDEECHSIPIAQQIARIYEKQLEGYFFPGDKSHGQAFIHLQDLIDCIQRVIQLRTNLAPHQTFVIGEENVMSYEDLQENLGELIHDNAWPTIRIPKVAAKVGAWVKDKFTSDGAFIKPWMIDLADQNYPVNLHRAHTLLGWKPKRTLRETLPTMVERLKRDPEHWYRINGLATEPSEADHS